MKVQINIAVGFGKHIIDIIITIILCRLMPQISLRNQNIIKSYPNEKKEISAALTSHEGSK